MGLATLLVQMGVGLVTLLVRFKVGLVTRLVRYEVEPVTRLVRKILGQHLDGLPCDSPTMAAT